SCRSQDRFRRDRDPSQLSDRRAEDVAFGRQCQFRPYRYREPGEWSSAVWFPPGQGPSSDWSTAQTLGGEGWNCTLFSQAIDCERPSAFLDGPLPPISVIVNVTAQACPTAFLTATVSLGFSLQNSQTLPVSLRVLEH